MKNITKIYCFLLFPALLSAQNGDKMVIDKVVATVGGEIILLSEVQEQYAYAKGQQPTLPEEYICISMQNLIVEKLLVNQAKVDSVVVSEDEVENELGARMERLMLYFNQDQQALEEYYGETVEQLKDKTRNDLRNQLLAKRMQGQITENATVTPSEVQEFFSNIPTDSLPYFNAEVEVREIVYKPRVNAEQKGIARQRITELRQRLSDGEDFATLAKKYSDDPGSGNNGGDLGWQKRGSFVPEFEAVLYNLEKGQISPIVETEFGFHVIQMLERRGNLVRARHILIRPEITEADLEAAKLKLDTVRNLLRMNNLTFTQAVKTYGDKNTASYNNDGRVANPRSGNTFFEVADLDTDIYFAIENLSVGDVTEPIPFRAPDGTRMYRLVLLQSRSKPHRADLRQDYSKIQTAALEQKKAEYTERWVIEKLRSTYLLVDPLFSGCPNIQMILEEAAASRP